MNNKYARRLAIINPTAPNRNERLVGNIHYRNCTGWLKLDISFYKGDRKKDKELMESVIQDIIIVFNNNGMKTIPQKANGYYPKQKSKRTNERTAH